jgi:uncharacterized protein (DUF2235 family)
MTSQKQEIGKKKETGKNIIICLDGTGNQPGGDRSNILLLFRMLDREPSKQITYYDPGVGTMGDPSFKTFIGRGINKALGGAFGRGLMKNMIQAYTFLMENYDDGDKVFIFGFSRGAYTARALAAFIKDCGLLDSGAENLLPYAKDLFLKKAPESNEKGESGIFHRRINRFRSTHGRLLNLKSDPKNPTHKTVPGYQLRIHFLGLFDTVKSYGWVKNPVVIRNEDVNPSVLRVRHAISIDEKRVFFRQMHWNRSPGQDCKEVWFAGSHSDVGGGYAEAKSGLAKITLEWMVHEAIESGMVVNPERYGEALQKRRVDGKWKNFPSVMEEKEDDNKVMVVKYSAPDPSAGINESLTWVWMPLQLLGKPLETWELYKRMRTIKSEKKRLGSENSEIDTSPVLIHKSVVDRMNIDSKTKYDPKNLYGKGKKTRIPCVVENGISNEEISEIMAEDSIDNTTDSVLK